MIARKLLQIRRQVGECHPFYLPSQIGMRLAGPSRKNFSDLGFSNWGVNNVSNLRSLFLTSFVVAATLMGASSATAGGRTLSGGHPYHNGYLFVPPASAYEAVNYRPPLRYGAPAYYFPQSYLAPEHVTPFPPVRTIMHERRFGHYYFSPQPVSYFYVW